MAYDATARLLHLAVSDVSGGARINKGTLKTKNHQTNTKDRKLKTSGDRNGEQKKILIVYVAR